MKLKYITPRSICSLSIIMWFVARYKSHDPAVKIYERVQNFL